MKNKYRENLKKIKDGLSDKEKLNNLLLDKLYRSIMSENKTHASILVKAIQILFPKSNVMIADAKFRALWTLGKHQEAIMLYVKTKRAIFWYSERVSRFYERQGQMSKAVEEYEFLMNTYSKMGMKGILPLPNGPKELFLLGRWYADKNDKKAKRFLELYLSAEEKCGTDPSFFLRYKNEAKRILDRLNSANE